MRQLINNIAEIPIAIPDGLVLRLMKLFENGKLNRLVELIEGVIEETGYGDVKIIVAEGKIQMLKAERSYK